MHYSFVDTENAIKLDDQKPAGSDIDVDGLYVRFTKSEPDLSPVAVISHEYCYPVVEPQNGVRHQPDTGPNVDDMNCGVISSSAVVPLPRRPRPPLDAKTVSNARRMRRPIAHCVYCCQPFDPSDADRRKCWDAPDHVMDRINIASCMCVPNAVAYLCFSDGEGDYEPVCACGGRPSVRCGMKWTALALLSMFLPCLCCYWPLVGCRRCAMICGYCVPQHRAA